MAEYDPLQLNHDANEFADSQFGQHHLERLRKQKARYLTVSMNADYTDSFRAHASSKASIYQAELEYFATARQIKEDPKLLARLAEKMKLRKNKEAEPKV